MLSFRFAFIVVYYPVLKSSTWKFFCGTVIPETWNMLAFDDHLWLDYTVSDSMPLFASGTHYYRISFKGYSAFPAFEVSVRYQHGIVAYVNQQEVFRDNMPLGIIDPFSSSVSQYASISFRSFLLEGNYIHSGTNIFAAELHFPSNIPHPPLFDAWIALLAPSPKSSCFVYPYAADLHGAGNALSFFTDGKLSTAGSAVLPTTLSVAFSDHMPMISAVGVYSDQDVEALPAVVRVNGVDIETRTQRVLASTAHWDWITDMGQFNSISLRRSPSPLTEMDLLFDGDRPLSVREIHFTICNRVPTLFSYSPTTLELVVGRTTVRAVPSISVLRHCTASPGLPAGLVLTEECVVEGRVSASVSMKVKVTTTTPVPVQATLVIHAVECSAHLVSIYRVYGNHTQFGEQVTLLDAVSQEVVYVDHHTQRFAPIEDFLCLPASQYMVVLSADSDIAWEAHSTLTLALLTTDDSIVLFRGRLDRQAREASYRFSLEGPIAFHSSWSYYAMGIPSDPGWESTFHADWPIGSSGTFPVATHSAQVYQKQFAVVPTVPTASVLDFFVRYDAGLVVFLNGHRVFSNVNATHLSNATVPSTAAPLRTRLIRLPGYDTGGQPYLTANNLVTIVVLSNRTQRGFDAALFLSSESVIANTPSSFSFKNGFAVTTPPAEVSADNPLVTISNTHVEWVADFGTPVWVNAISIQLANTVYGAVVDIEVCGMLDGTRKDLLDSDSGLDFAFSSAVTVYLPNWEAFSEYEVALHPRNNQMSPIAIQSLVFLSTHASGAASLVYDSLTLSTYQYVDCHRPAVRAFHSYSLVVQTPQGNLTAFTINPVTGCISGSYTSEVSTTCVVSAYTPSNRLVTARFHLTVTDLSAASVLLSLYAHDLGDVGKYKVIREDGLGIYHSAAALEYVDSAESVVTMTRINHHAVFNFTQHTSAMVSWFVVSVSTNSIWTELFRKPVVPLCILQRGWGGSQSVVRSVTGHQQSAVAQCNAEVSQGAAAQSGAETDQCVTAQPSFDFLPAIFGGWGTHLLYHQTRLEPPTDWFLPNATHSFWVKTTLPLTLSQSTLITQTSVAFAVGMEVEVVRIVVSFVGIITLYWNGVQIGVLKNYVSIARTFYVWSVTAPIHRENMLAVRVDANPHVMENELHSLYMTAGRASALAGTFNVASVASYPAVEDTPMRIFRENRSAEVTFRIENGGFFTWCLEDDFPPRFNRLYVTLGRVNSLSFTLYGLTECIDGNAFSPYNATEIYHVVHLSTAAPSTLVLAVPLAMMGFRSFFLRFDQLPTRDRHLVIHAIRFGFHADETLASCAAVDAFPAVPHGEISPVRCASDRFGYVYRECSRGVLSAIHNDRCKPKPMSNVTYGDVITRFLGYPIVPVTPSYEGIVEHFESVDIPQRLVLDAKTGALSGTVHGSSATLVSFEVAATNELFREVTRVRMLFEPSVCKTEGVWTETTAEDYSDVVTCDRIGRGIGLAWRLCKGTPNGGQWETIQGICIPKSYIVLLLVLIVGCCSCGLNCMTKRPKLRKKK